MLRAACAAVPAQPSCRDCRVIPVIGPVIGPEIGPVIGDVRFRPRDWNG
jgi:hypothetical protein